MQDKIAYRICDLVSGKLNETLVETFTSERLEYFLKGVFSLTNSNTSSNGLLSSGLNSGMGLSGASSIGNSSSSSVMDNNKYEDYARVLLGKNAFLLFQFDKISN